MRVSLDASTSGTPRTFFDPSSTPMTTVPPAVFANATRHLRMPSGEDKSRLYSRVFPSLRFSSSTSLTTQHFTQKRPAAQHFRPDRHCHRWDYGHGNGAAVSGPVRRKSDFAVFLCRRTLNMRSRSPQLRSRLLRFEIRLGRRSWPVSATSPR